MADPRQLPIDIDVPDSPSPDEVKHARYDELLAVAESPTCLPEAGVHIYLDHRGTGPCQCQSTPNKGAR